MLHALILAVAVGSCPNAQTQMAINECSAAQAKQADAQLNATYARVRAELKTLGKDPDLLVPAEQAWISARDKTCTFEASLYEGGSIQPSIYSGCLDSMTVSRTKRLNAYLAALQSSQGTISPAAPVSSTSDTQLNHVYAAYLKNITPAQAKALKAAEVAWIAYRDQACKVEGSDCLTVLETERTTELKSAWMGDPIW